MPGNAQELCQNLTLQGIRQRLKLLDELFRSRGHIEILPVTRGALPPTVNRQPALVTTITCTADPRHLSRGPGKATVLLVNVPERYQSVAQPGEIRRVPLSLAAFAVLPHFSVGTLTSRSPLSGGHRLRENARPRV